MSTDSAPEKPYSFRYRSPAQEIDIGKSPGADLDGLFSIRDTLLLLTGGCVTEERADGTFCAKHGRPLLQGNSKCDYLQTRFSQNVGEEQSKAQLQRYVNEMLGVRDPKMVRRLAGLDPR